MVDARVLGLVVGDKTDQAQTQEVGCPDEVGGSLPPVELWAVPSDDVAKQHNDLEEHEH